MTGFFNYLLGLIVVGGGTYLLTSWPFAIGAGVAYTVVSIWAMTTFYWHYDVEFKVEEEVK